MIFAVAGTQLPFPRLMQALDALALRHGLQVVAQTADPAFRPQAMVAHPFMAPAMFDDHLARCRLVVAHAGMGIIIAAASRARPLVLMPRQARLREHRNDHQMATARRFAGKPGLTIAEHETALEAALLAADPAPFDPAGSGQRASLIAAVRGALLA